MNKIAFCITGWHYPADFYVQLKSIPGIDIFVVSHQPQQAVPGFIFEIIPAGNILFKPNYGYDWGCFQQFLETDLWRSYEYIFFMHDDLSILDTGFVEACLKLLNDGYAVVGNGRQLNQRDWPRIRTGYYAHAAWQLPALDFEHDVVRGSFFATRRDVLEKLGSFEVFWDRFHLAIGFGNYSLLASSGKMSYLFGPQTFAYLSTDYLTSPYIVELERGGAGKENSSKGNKYRQYLFNHVFMFWYKRLSNAYVLATLKKEMYFPGRLAQAFRKKMIHLFAGR